MSYIRTIQRLLTGVLTLAVIACVASTQAATVHDEAVSGDLADAVYAAPGFTAGTPVGTLSSGSNTVLGEFGSDTGDTDLFTFVVPAGHQLDAIVLGYTILSGDPVNGSYFAINDGPDLGVVSAVAGDNLGDALTATPGDIMDDLQTGTIFSSASGLQIPSPAGTYTLFLSELGAQISYSLDLQVSSVPEPRSAAIVSLALLMGALSTGRAKRMRLGKSA